MRYKAVCAKSLTEGVGPERLDRSLPASSRPKHAINVNLISTFESRRIELKAGLVPRRMT
jgi:hypothetical protein